MNDTDAFVDLYRIHYPRVVAALGLAGADPARAQDLGQEAFARTYHHWRRVRRGTNPAGYVYTVAFRLMRRRSERLDDGLDGHDHPSGGSEDGTLNALTIAQAIEAMPTRRRACAALCFYLGFSGEQAAEILGIAASTVRVQLGRARADLARALSDTAPAEAAGGSARFA
ncbi:MAG: RNA polymerase sigma factor [Acidimicrobiales bacterium]